MIPDLPPTYVRHLVEPRGQIDLPAAEAAGQQGSMVGGLGVRVTLTWREGLSGEAVVRDAGVRVFGSPGPLAPASYLSQRILGLTPGEAQSIDADDVLTGLVGDRHDVLPEAVRRGAYFVVDALRCALGLPNCRPADPQGPGVLVCRCTSVGDREIRNAIAHGALTVDAVGDRCGACTGCGSCRPDILVLIHEELTGSRESPSPDLAPVVQIVLARVAPVLAAQGLPLRDVEVTDDTVTLRLGTPVAGAMLTPRGAREIAHQILRQTVADDVQVLVESAA